jgi:hypothetical protein
MAKRETFVRQGLVVLENHTPGPLLVVLLLRRGSTSGVEIRTIEA